MYFYYVFCNLGNVYLNVNKNKSPPKRAKISTLVHTKLILWMSELLTVSNVNENDMERVTSFLKSQIFGDLLLFQ